MGSFREHLGATSIGDKIREIRLRWVRMFNISQQKRWLGKDFLCKLMAHQREGIAEEHG